MIKYKINEHTQPALMRQNDATTVLDKNLFFSAVIEFQKKIDVFYSAKIDIATLLGMRNLSATIGEIFAQSFAEVSNGLFIKNPHQDGYPDLLLMDTIGTKLYQQIEKENLLQEKARFSPFKSGGIEVKATCGSVPTPADCNKKGLVRPDLGVQRISLLKGYDWKAHHRETNNLIGLTWDFIDKTPVITSVQYSSNLTELYWGKIVQPKEGGGRTTSVSIMTREGVATMCRGWVMVIDNENYIKFFERYNKIMLF